MQSNLNKNENVLHSHGNDTHTAMFHCTND